MKVLDWHRCYGKSWTGVLDPDSFTHPAKFSRRLIERIYRHCFRQGWIQAGDTVLDPFGGVALGAWPALRRGINWIGVELEQKFVDLGNKNIALWDRRYGPHYPDWGQVALIQGDSRRLPEIIKEAAAVIGSPPYASGTVHGNSGISPENFAEPERAGHNCQSRTMEDYGATLGQLSKMPEGDLEALISSPPYEATVNARGHGIDWSKAGPATGNRRRGDGTRLEATLQAQMAYSENKANLGNVAGDTFWGAARAIVANCAALLQPGGIAAWVVKDYVRNYEIVPFTDNWRRMCEASGFEMLQHVRAWFVVNNGTQRAMFGEDLEHITQHKSFFRRLYEQKGGPRIDYESVLIMRKATCPIKSA